MTLVSTVLIVWRWRRGDLQDERQFAHLLSRESMFVLNNIIFMILFVAIFWGSFGAPIVSELFIGTEISLGTEVLQPGHRAAVRVYVRAHGQLPRSPPGALPPAASWDGPCLCRALLLR